MADAALSKIACPAFKRFHLSGIFHARFCAFLSFCKYTAYCTAGAGLIIADAWGAEIMRDAAEDRLAPARRKAVTLLIARAASLRLQSSTDPNTGGAL